MTRSYLSKIVHFKWGSKCKWNQSKSKFIFKKSFKDFLSRDERRRKSSCYSFRKWTLKKLYFLPFGCLSTVGSGEAGVDPQNI